MSSTQKIALNTAVQLLGKAVTVATSLLVIAYLTRYLGVAGYGDYATIFAYLGIFGVIVDLGLFVIAVREIAKNPLAEASILRSMLGLKITLGVGVFALAYLITFGLPYSNIIRHGILLGAISQLFISLNQIPLSSFQANLVMYKATVSDVLGRLLMLGLVWWFIQEHQGLSAMVLAVVVANVVAFGVNILLVGYKYWLWPTWDVDKWREIFWQALPIGLVMVLGVIYFRVDTLILAALKGSFAVGLYNAPYKVLEVLLVVPSIFMSSVLPVMTTALHRAQGEAQVIFQKSFNFLSIIALPLIAGTLVVATPVMVLVAGEEFTTSGPLLQILSLALGGAFLNSAMIYTIIAADQQHRLLFPYFGAVVFNIVANLLVIPLFSYWGAAVVTVLTELWVLLATMYLAIKYLHLKIYWQVFGKALVISIVMGGILYVLRHLEVVWLVIIGASVYGVMLLLTKTVTKAEILEMLPQGRRW